MTTTLVTAPGTGLQAPEPSPPGISVGAFAGPGASGKLLRVAAPVIDQALGISALARRYHALDLSGLDAGDAVTRILAKQEITIEGADAVAAAVPGTGPAIVVCNHPHGGIDGLLVAYALLKVRPDVKILANSGLRVLGQLRELFIFTDSLSPGAAGNVTSLRTCERHLRRDGLLVVFPAGAVSSLTPETHKNGASRIADGAWHRAAAQLALSTGASLMGVFITGSNSRLFHTMGRIHRRLRLLMLARETLKTRGQALTLIPTRLFAPKALRRLAADGGAREITRLVRALVYQGDPAQQTHWPQITQGTLEPIATPFDPARIAAEIADLPEEQHLVRAPHFSAHYGYAHQMPETVREICRLRELTFRTLDEGSGQALDTDRFDATYMHLFLTDNRTGDIVGAYRFGQTDRLLGHGGIAALYLSAMFEFQPNFVNRRTPCLEMGRSFIAPAYQRSPHALYLLWKGIGAFLCQNPRYRTLYGTVSLSTTYTPSTVAVIERALAKPDERVTPRKPLNVSLHPELYNYLGEAPLPLTQLDRLVQGLEQDDKHLPVLVKQYAKLGARFYGVGIDQSFRDTPGLLLSIHLPSAPTPQLKRYLGEGRHAYLKHGDSAQAAGETPC